MEPKIFTLLEQDKEASQADFWTLRINLCPSVCVHFHLLQVLCLCSNSEILMDIANSFCLSSLWLRKNGKDSKNFNRKLSFVLQSPGVVDEKSFTFHFFILIEHHYSKSERSESRFIKRPATGLRLAASVGRELALVRHCSRASVWSEGAVGLSPLYWARDLSFGAEHVLVMEFGVVTSPKLYILIHAC